MSLVESTYFFSDKTILVKAEFDPKSYTGNEMKNGSEARTVRFEPDVTCVLITFGYARVARFPLPFLFQSSSPLCDLVLPSVRGIHRVAVPANDTDRESLDVDRLLLSLVLCPALMGRYESTSGRLLVCVSLRANKKLAPPGSSGIIIAIMRSALRG